MNTLPLFLVFISEARMIKKDYLLVIAAKSPKQGEKIAREWLAQVDSHVSYTECLRSFENIGFASHGQNIGVVKSIIP